MASEISIDQSQLATPPILYAEITLCFDCNLPVDSLNDIIGLQAIRAMRRQDTRINPFTKRHNPGYWSYRTKRFSSFDCEELFALVSGLLVTHTAEFEKVIRQYTPCELFVRIYVAVQQEGEFPAIRIDPVLLSTLSSLNAYIDIIVENDYADSSCEQ